MVIVTVTHPRHSLQVYQDRDFLQIVLPDEKKFIDHARSFVLFGHQEDKKIDGKMLIDL